MAVLSYGLECPGHVAVLYYNESSSLWEQNTCFVTEGNLEELPIDISSDGKTVATTTRIHKFDESTMTWNAVGESIPQTRMSMSSDGTTIAVTSFTSTGGGQYVETYACRSSVPGGNLTIPWIFSGNIETSYSDAGDDIRDTAYSVDLSASGLTMVVGAQTGGTVKVFQYNYLSSQWDQKGDDLAGRNPGTEERFGLHVAMAPQNSNLIVAVRQQGANYACELAVYDQTSDQWIRDVGTHFCQIWGRGWLLRTHPLTEMCMI